MISVNPYELLGVNSTSSIKELKNNYYNLALYCHPDKGGSNKDMITLKNSYNYIKDQLNNCTTKTYEELESDFENFCKNQEEKSPEFCKIFSETHEEWSNKFNDTFTNNKYSNLFDIGYGNLMENKENIESKYNFEVKGEIKNKFSTELITYEQPQPLPIEVENHIRLDLNSIDDFTYKDMTDYKLAYSEPPKLDNFFKEKDITLEELINSRRNTKINYLIVFGKSKYYTEYNLAKRLQFHLQNSVIHDINNSKIETKFDYVIGIGILNTYNFIKSHNKPYSIILTNSGSNLELNQDIKLLLYKSKFIITLNNKLSNIFQNRYNINNIRIIPPAVDLTYSIDEDFKEKNYYLLFIEEDINKINEFTNEFNTFNYIMIGNNQDNTFLSKIPKNIKYINIPERNNLMNYIKNSNGLINITNQDIDEIITSAMGLDCPIITKNIDDIIDNNETGLIFNDWNDLKQIFQKDKTKIILKAKNHIFNNYSITDEYWKYNELFIN